MTVSQVPNTTPRFSGLLEKPMNSTYSHIHSYGLLEQKDEKQNHWKEKVQGQRKLYTSF